MQLSSSAQGMRSGEGWGSGPASPFLTEYQKGESRQRVQGGGAVPSDHICGGWAPSRQGNITRQSSHPLALHLQALLPHLPPPLLLRSH